MTLPTRAVAIVLNENKVLLIKRKSKGKEYFVFPGGKVEDNERVEEAVIREVIEETTLEVGVDRLLYKHHYIGSSDQFFYLCEYISGQPNLGDGNEKEDMEKFKDEIYLPLWVEVSHLKDLLIYPLEIRDWLIKDIEDGFQETPREIELKVGELRDK